MAETATAQSGAAPSPGNQPQQQTTTSTQARTTGGQFDKGNTLPIERQAGMGDAQKEPKETPAERRIRLKLADDGPEEEFDERTLAGLARRGKNAAQLMSRADKVRMESERRVRDAEAKLARIKDDPVAVLRELGVDPLALSEQQILRALEEEKERQLPPEERALRQKAREADELRAKLKQREQQEQSAREEQETEKYREQLAGLFTEVMQRSGLPKSSARAVMHRVASVVQAADSVGEQVDPDEAAAYVVEQLRQEQRAVVSGMSVSELAEWLGPEIMLAIRKHDLAQYRQRKGGGAPPPAPSGPAPKPAPALHSRKGRWAHIEQLLKE